MNPLNELFRTKTKGVEPKNDEKALIKIPLKNGQLWEKEYNQTEFIGKVINDFKEENNEEFPEEYMVDWKHKNKSLELSNQIRTLLVNEVPTLIIDYKDKIKPLVLGEEVIPDIIGKPFYDPFEIFAFHKINKILKIQKYDNEEIEKYELNNYGPSSTYCNGKNQLFISGGEKKNTEIIDKFWIINLENQKIEETTMEPKKNHSMIYIRGNYVFFVGGNDLKTFYYDIENGQMNAWVDLNKNRTEPSLMLINENLYCIDNVNSKNNNDEFTLEKTNITSEKPEWEIIKPNLNILENQKLNQKFFGVINDKDENILFLGGNMNEDKNEKYNYKYNIDTNNIESSNIPFEEYNFKEKTFLPYNNNVDYILPDFNRNHPEVIFYQKNKNKVSLIKYKPNTEIKIKPKPKTLKYDFNFNMPSIANRIPTSENKYNKEEEKNNDKNNNIVNEDQNININININGNNYPNLDDENKNEKKEGLIKEEDKQININIDENIGKNNLFERDINNDINKPVIQGDNLDKKDILNPVGINNEINNPISGNIKGENKIDIPEPEIKLTNQPPPEIKNYNENNHVISEEQKIDINLPSIGGAGIQINDKNDGNNILLDNKIKYPEFDMDNKYKDIKPNAKIDSEKLNLDDIKKSGNKSEIKIEGEKLDMELPKIDADGFKINLNEPDINIDEPKSDINNLKIDVNDIKINLNEPEMNIDGTNLVINNPKRDDTNIKINKHSINIQDSKLDLNNRKIDANIKVPNDDPNKLKQDININGPTIDIYNKNYIVLEGIIKGTKSINKEKKVPSAKIDIDGPKIKSQDININGNVPDIKINSPDANANINLNKNINLGGNIDGENKIEIKNPNVNANFDLKNSNNEKNKLADTYISGIIPGINASTNLNINKDINLKGPNLKSPDIKIEGKGPDLDINGPKFNIPSGGGDFNLNKNIDIDSNFNNNIKIDNPSINPIKAEIGINGPNIDINHQKKSINKDNPELKLKSPNIDTDLNLDGNLKEIKNLNQLDGKLPNVEIKVPKIEGTGNLDLDGKINESSKNDVNGKKFYYISGIIEGIKDKKISVESKNTQVKGSIPGISVNAPNVKGNLPNVNINGPKISTNNIGGNINFKDSKGELGGSIPGVDVKNNLNLPSTNINLNNGPEINHNINITDQKLEGPNAEINLKDGKLPNFNLPNPKIDGQLDGNINSKNMNKNLNYNLPGVKMGSSKIDINGPSVNSKSYFHFEGIIPSKNAQNININGENIKFSSNKNFHGSINQLNFEGQSGIIQGSRNLNKVNLGGNFDNIKGLRKLEKIDENNNINIQMPKIEIKNKDNINIGDSNKIEIRGGEIDGGINLAKNIPTILNVKNDDNENNKFGINVNIDGDIKNENIDSNNLGMNFNIEQNTETKVLLNSSRGGNNIKKSKGLPMVGPKSSNFEPSKVDVAGKFDVENVDTENLKSANVGVNGQKIGDRIEQ